ncbi:MAG: homoserine kinase [Mariprofundus sp.]|nr:homoserine kinase [Mariprofundus sp.]
MSVYTELSHADISTILADYQIGSLISFEGIAAGIENSNFFIDTSQGKRYVLTVFERLAADELPYFMLLMKHLAANALACPDVMVRNDDALLFEVHGKQGCIVSCLSGRTLDELNIAQLKSSGQAMAQLHLAGADFSMQRANPTNSNWLAEHIDAVLEKTCARYGSEAGQLLNNELDFQSSCAWGSLPAGLIHGDLFVDNILFKDEQVSGIIDFYYAHHAAFAMDIAIALNAQAVLLSDADESRIQAFMDGYQSLRPLQEDECEALPLLLRLAALRFWVSRLYDAFFPRDGAMVQTKDPEEYRQKLVLHHAASLFK